MSTADKSTTYILALDQGTTSSRSILFDHEGHVCAVDQHEFTQYFPKPGWVEHDACEILSTQLSTAVGCLTKAGVDPARVEAIGITNQRETTVVWDRATGQPIAPAIVWQCRRTAEAAAALVEAGHGPRIRELTGLVPDAYFSATKVAWILDHVEGARERAEAGELLFGTIDTWLVWNLTGGAVHATDYTNASRTMLFDIHRRVWSEELCELCRVPMAMLPEVRPSSGDFGVTAHPLLSASIPIRGVAGDQQAALFGQCCFAPGEAKNTYGTGCFLLLNTGQTPVSSTHGLVTTLAVDACGQPCYALEGSVFVAGALIKWLRDELGLIETSGETCALAQSVADNAGVYIVPAFTGLGAPYWDADARGAILGLTRGATRAHIARAALEALAYQVYDVLDAMRSDGAVQLSELKADGGASANDFLMQFQSDILGVPVARPALTETTALGAAYLAGLSSGYWADADELRSHWSLERRFDPAMEPAAREALLAGWNDAVARTLTGE